jgi:hypothetical protein
MKRYDPIAALYDPALGDRRGMAATVRKWIGRRPEQPARILELACGTASILGSLPERWELWGIDESESMLRQARRKVPRGRFLRDDISRFRLRQSFDAIICILDSINHLIGFRNWEQTFTRVKEHLEPRGVFIFDVYTIRKLQSLDYGSPFLSRIGRNYFMVDAFYGGQGVLRCKIAIFEHLAHDRYRLRETEIAERAFPLLRIRRTLQKYFREVQWYGENGRRPSESADRVFFVCRGPVSAARRSKRCAQLPKRAKSVR